MLKRISWQAIFTHSSPPLTTTDASAHMDSRKDASVPPSFDRVRRPSTSISLARQSVDSSLPTTTTTATTPVLTANSKVAKPIPSRSSPPPAYLLDDDPFANLTPMTVGTRHRPSSSVGSTSSCIPRSRRPPPIHPDFFSLPAVPVGSQSPKSRLQDMSRIQPRPAHQRPAFATRPSLPSLDTLAKTNVVLTKKVKKGRVGAGLPFEPWDNLPEDDQESYTAPYKLATPTTPITIATNIPTKTENLCSIYDIDRTPTSTPVSAAPTSPPRPASPSIHSSAISTKSLLTTPPLQPFIPAQTVGIGPLVEDIDPDTPSPFLCQLAPTSKPDPVVLPSISSSPNLSNNSHTLAAPVALLPSVPEESILRNLEEGNDMFPPSDTDSDRNSTDDENGYFNGDLYGVPYTPELLPNFHNSQLPWTHRSDDPEASANKGQQLRWSLATYDANESQPHSPTSSNSYAGSMSDLSSGLAYPPSYSFGYSGGWSNSDQDSMTDVFRHFSFSRSISSTSLSTSSTGDDIESSINFSISRSASTSDSSQGTDLSQSVCDHLLSSSSALIVYSDSGTNSILHSPDSEWTSLAQKRIHPSHLPDVLVGPALQKRSILPLGNSAADHQTEPVRDQLDSEPESNMPIAAALQTSGQGDPEDAQETYSHAVAHDVFHESSATAEDPIPAPNIDSAPDSFPFLKPHHESLVEPVVCLATPSDQVDTAESQQPILAERFLSRTSPSTLNPPDHQHLETAPDEMNGIDNRLREKMAHFGSVNVGPSAVSTTSAKRDNKSGEEEERRRRKILLQMRRGYSFQRSSDDDDDKAIQQRGLSRSTDVAYTLSARSPKIISRAPSAATSPSNPPKFPSGLSMTSTSEGEEQDSVSSDDDVPLAQRIPGALTAQKSIRKQVHDEREARRVARERSKRERQLTLRPAAGLEGVDSTALSSSQDLHTAPSSSNPIVGNGLTASGSVRQRSGSFHHRQKILAVPNVPPPAPHADFGQAFKPEDLARKLQNVKMMTETSPAVSNMRFLQVDKLSRSVSSVSRPAFDHPATSLSPAPRLKTKRSFHAPEVEHQARDAVLSQDHLPPRKRSMSLSTGDRDRTSRRGHEDSVPPLPNTTLQGRTNLGDRGRRVLVKAPASSYDLERLQHDIHDVPTAGVEGVITTRHRIFIHSLQLSHMVDIRPDTSANDLITSLETEGVLDGWAGLGGWTIWEVAQDFGMERPLRNYELLSDVQSSWMAEKTVNYFLLKKSSLSSRLDRSAIPSSAPGHSGWVEWEAKRGKWSKRWLRLKENCLYISKKDGRDENLLCSLSNFDAYYITRSHRAPKPFAFTIKSTDKLSFFENMADYMHTFSCSEKDGEAWVEKIQTAKSYVLHQERSALFHPNKGPSNATNTVFSTLSRSGTKKTTTVTKLLPHQPLVNLGSDDIFEPGSLLSKEVKDPRHY